MTQIEDELKKLEQVQSEKTTQLADLEKAKADTKEWSDKRDALAKELDRVTQDVTKAKEQRRQLDEKDASFQDKLRNENLVAASKKFFESFKYEPDAQKTFLENQFKKFDSGAITTDNIYRDMLSARVAADPERYVGLESKVSQLERNAAEYSATASGAAAAGAGEAMKPENVVLTEDDWKAIRFSGMSVDKYRELKARGVLD